MQCHFRDVRNLVRKHQTSDTFARHFAEQTQNFHHDPRHPTPKLLRQITTLQVLWKGSPLGTVKTFGTRNCLLCNNERLQICKWMRTKPNLLINRCTELYGACRHKAHFHRFPPASLSSTDEASMAEKVPVEVDV